MYIYIKLGFAASQKIKRSSLWIPHGGFTIGTIKNHQQITGSVSKVIAFKMGGCSNWGYL